MKILTINRKWYTAQTTVGELIIEGVRFCYTLEDTVRAYGVKVKHHSAIPGTGDITYKIGLTFSPKFNRDVLVIFTHEEGGRYFINNGGVQFEAVYFHGGNSHEDSSACPLVAYNVQDDYLKIFGTAEKELFTLVKSWLDAGVEVRLKIVNQKNLLQ